MEGSSENIVCLARTGIGIDRQQMSCQLTPAALRERKSSVLAELKESMLEKRELENGFAYRFTGTNEMLDRLLEFIKTESACCSFLVFTLSVDGTREEAWLNLTGNAGVKDFIQGELDL